jgi:hypothetical protein
MARRFAWFLLTVVILAPIAFVAPLGGATTGETCVHISGAAFFAPPLPDLLSKAKVPLTLTTKGVKVYTCTGSGGAIGNASLTVKSAVKTNCRSLSTSLRYTATGAGKINWTKGKPSTLALTFTFPRFALSPQVTGRVTAGQFKGLPVSASLVLDMFTGNCGSTPLSKMSIHFATGTAFVIGKPPPPPPTTTTYTLPPSTIMTTPTTTMMADTTTSMDTTSSMDTTTSMTGP